MGLIEYVVVVMLVEVVYGYCVIYLFDILFVDLCVVGLYVEIFGGVVFKGFVNF